jgi:hypothetical protein
MKTHPLSCPFWKTYTLFEVSFNINTHQETLHR